jgi:hypothetical protein
MAPSAYCSDVAFCLLLACMVGYYVILPKGANGLRGKKVYSAKTACGPWLDAVGGPQGYRRGFTSSDFVTEAQAQQTGALISTRPKEFGAGISVPVLKAQRTADNVRSMASPP